MKGRSTTKIAALSVAALFTAGCLSEGGDSTNESGGGDDTSDGSIEIFGAFGGGEGDAFNDSLEAFREESGIDIEYVSSPDFTNAIQARVRGNDAPDIAIFPQPGLLVDLAESGDLVALDDVIDLDGLKETLIPGMVESTETDEGSFGVPMRMAAKSIIWSPAPEFEEAGYTSPTTTEELLSLTDEIRDSGTAPWCIGIESGPATGWVVTDWLEEYVLRIGGEEFYNQWVRHEVPFNDPIVVEAAEQFAEIAFTDGNVLGGRGSIASSNFGTAGNGMFEDPPQCYLHRQANFITSGDFFPSEVTADLDSQVTVSQLPPADDAGPAMLLGGDWATMFDADNAEAVQVLEFLASDQFGGEWAGVGGWLSPHTTFDASQYPDETTRAIFQFAVDAETTGVDGSDQMPGEVGAGSFWRGMTSWVSGQQELEEVLDEIEGSWPED